MRKFVQVFSNTSYGKMYIIVCNHGDSAELTNPPQSGPTCSTNSQWQTKPSDLGLENWEIVYIYIDLKWR